MFDALKESGIEMPFPQRGLHHRISEDQLERFAAMIK
jgi:small-conductance mechanosensitive channel